MNLSHKKILVTGSDGFIGSHLVEHLIDNGYAVRAFAYYNSFNSLGWLDTLDPKKLKKAEIVTGDIRDPAGVRRAVKGCPVVMHLAALIAIPFSYHSPDSYVDTNVKGTLNILNACRDLDTEKLLVTSTSEVYGTAQYVPIDEEHRLYGQSPYAATKIGADQLALSYHASFDMPLTIIRPFNTYGPRQSARAIIPTIITQIAAGQKKLCIGNPKPTRDFTFVLDTAAGFVKVAQSDKTIGQVVNIGSNQEITIGALAVRIKKLMKSTITIVSEKTRLRPDHSEVERLRADNAKAAKLAGWKPRYDLDRGLKLTITWFSDPENLRKYKSGEYNI